jgi:hypothetical protein
VCVKTVLKLKNELKKMKPKLEILLLSSLVFLGTAIYSQKEIQATASFRITGEVKTSTTINLTDFSNWKAYDIGDVIITNHLGEKKSEVRQLKGILLRDVLSTIEINSESPKQLSEYYVVCKANDGYKVVFSWNEIFNTVLGNSIFLITEKEGKPAVDLPESILLLSTKDLRTGRRHVKALQTIEIKRAQ